jgi:branched-chain amino acid transport system substrate-binding protein
MPKSHVFVPVLLLLLLLACSQPQQIRVGAFLSLTGATASYGISAANAIRLAADELLAGFFAESFKKLGGQIVSQQQYEANATDLSAQMQAIKTAAPDIIFAPGFYTTAPLVAREVKRAETRAILVGSDGWDSPDLMKDGSEVFEGVYFANHFWAGSDDPLVRKFVADYRAKYGVEPDAGAATAYDAARMLFDAFKRAKSTESSAVRNALARTKDFAGVTGKITLDANRNAQVPVYMLRIEKGGKFTLQHQG